jgi:CO dehydrogenase/acetyl-CoA synthase delta subunit
MPEFAIDHPHPNQVNGTYREPPPANKDVTINLLQFNAPMVGIAYRVKTVTNTVWYKPGDWLTESVVAEICKIPRWTINIESYELLKKIMDTVGPKISLV